MKKWLLVSVILPLALVGQESCVQEDCHVDEDAIVEAPPTPCPEFLSCKRSPMRASLRHIEAGGIGYSHGYTSLDLVLGGQGDQWYPFVDLRGHYFNHGSWAANGGFGLRFLPNSWNTIFGFNSYYDYRRAYKTHFQQMGAGLEFLRKGWEVRVNGYLPFGTKSSPFSNASFGYFQGNNIYLKAKKHVAMAGGDAEVGYNVVNQKSSCSLFLGIGPYYYHPPCGKNAIGGRVRATAKFTDYLSVDVVETYDNVFHNNLQGQIALNFSFGPKGTRSSKQPRPPALEYRMVQPVFRDEIIVLSKCTQYPIAIDPATGEPYFVLFVNNTSSSQGTYESPYPTFAQVEAVYHPNDLIYVFPGDGLTTGMSSGITLLDHQQLLGSSVPHPLNTQFGFITVPAQTNGFSPIIANSSGAVVTIANDNTVSGFYIQFLNGAGITNGATARQGLTATQNIFEGSGFNAIDLTSANLSGTLNVASNQFNIDDSALAITSSSLENTNYAFTDNYITTTDTTAAIALSYTNCSGIATQLTGNTIQAPGASITLTVNNASTPANANTFTLENNDFNSRTATFPITLQGSSNTSFAVNSNTLFSARGSVMSITASGAAATSFSVSSNTVNAPLDLFTTTFFAFAGTNTGASHFALNSNQINAGVGMNIAVQNCAFSIAADSNTFNSYYNPMVFAYAGSAVGPISITNNDLNTPSSAAQIGISSSGSANNTGITIANNSIGSSSVATIDISLASSDNGAISISNNTIVFNNTARSAVAVTTTGVNPISFTGNTLDVRGSAGSGLGGIEVSLQPSSGTLQPVSFANNTISSLGRGIGVTVGSASANVSLGFEGNTIYAGEQGINVTVSTAAAVATTVLNNNIESSSIAYFLSASGIASPIPLTCNMQNNHFQVGNSNGVKFTVAEAVFDATIKNNQFGLIVLPPYVKEELLISYTGNAASAIANVTIDNNLFRSADTELSISVLGAAANMTANITNNLFALSGSAGSAGATATLTTASSNTARWNIQGNTFESWDTSAVTVTASGTSTACASFTNNKAQPIPSAYTFTNTSGNLTLSASNNVGQITSTATVGTCP